jgi:glycosyltransferase involved in cell wall biosynthesis
MARKNRHPDYSDLAISVVICTYNRAELLANALQTLCEQTINNFRYEVLVVDNNSMDNTRAVTENFCRSYPNIRYCFEERQGLSHARNRGWREANGTYVAYIDDECKVPAHWLAVANLIIKKLSPAVFGGPYYGYHNSSTPRWWKKSYESFEHSKMPRALSDGEYLRGANIFIQRNLLAMIGGFNPELGMTGKKLAFGEESNLQRRIRATMDNDIIYYDPELYIYHLVRPEKMTWRYILKSRFAGGRHIYTVFFDNTSKKSRLPQLQLLVQTIATFFMFFADIFIGMLKRDRKHYPYLQNYLYEKSFGHVQKLGFIYERYTH